MIFTRHDSMTIFGNFLVEKQNESASSPYSLKIRPKSENFKRF